VKAWFLALADYVQIAGGPGEMIASASRGDLRLHRFNRSAVRQATTVARSAGRSPSFTKAARRCGTTLSGQGAADREQLKAMLATFATASPGPGDPYLFYRPSR